MAEYFASDEWKEIVRWDEILYAAANRSLDLTIDRLGRDEFQIQLKQFQYYKHHVETKCVPEVRMPCSPEGVKRDPQDVDCLFNDMGCGFDCIDQIFETVNDKESTSK